VVAEQYINAGAGSHAIDTKKLGLHSGIYYGELAASAGILGTVRFVNK
jgi:hypothetical protein